MSEYQHRPDQGPGGDKQFLMYMMLAFVLVLLLQGIFFKRPPKLAPAPSEQPAANAPAPSATPVATFTKNAPAPAPQKAEGQKVEGKHASSEGEIVVEDELYRVVLTNRGGQAKSWQLKKYNNDKGQPLDLVNDKASALMGLPLSLWTYDDALRTQISNALFVVSAEDCKNDSGQELKVDANGGSQSCRFSKQMAITYDFAEGDLSIHKKITFDGGYIVGIEAAVLQKGVPVQAYPAWPSALGDQTNPAGFASGRVDWRTSDSTTHVPAFEHNFIRPNKWVSGGATLRDGANWIGVSDQYFAAVFMPALPRSAVAVTLNQAMEISKNPAKPDPNETVKVPVLGVAVGDPGGTTRERLYVGPKDFD